MKKINKNSIHVLSVERDSYLEHPSPEKFSMDGKKPFTIEIFFTITSENTGIIYGQEDGFRFGLDKGKLYFDLEEFGYLIVPDNMAITDCGYYFAAVVFDGTQLSLYINGLEIANTPTGSVEQAATGNYTIGKDFNGYIANVRLFSKALPDETLLHDNANPLEKIDGCQLWTDFSDIQYTDKSDNHLPLWQVGNKATCTNITACSILKGRGCYRKADTLKIGTTYTLIGKFLPNLSISQTGYLFSVGEGEGTLFSIQLVKKGSDSFIALVSNEKQIISTKRVEPYKWCDLAIVLSGGEAKLFIDGEEDVSETFSFAPQQEIGAVVGTQYYTKTPVFSDAYIGYLDYFAEFDRELSTGEIDEYAENPPYVYADGIQSLMYFGWGEPMDVVSNLHMNEVGDGKFTMAADTNPQNAPQGIDQHVPTTEDPEWSKLSDEEKWELGATVAIVSGTLASLMGMGKKEGGIPPERSSTLRLRRNYARLNQEVRDYSPPPNPETSQSGMELAINGGDYGSVGNVAAVPAGGASFFSMGSVCSFLSTYWPVIVGVTAVVAAAVVISEIIEKEEEKRPAVEGDVKIESVNFNHNGDPAIGSIHFHTGVNCDGPISMIYPVTGGRIKADCVMVPSLMHNAYLDVVLTSSKADAFTGTLQATNSTIGEKIFGDCSKSFTIPAKGKVTVQLPLDASNLPSDKCIKRSKTLMFSCDKLETPFLTNCDITAYTLLKEPIIPWSNPKQPYSKDQPGYVSTVILDFFQNKNKSEEIADVTLPYAPADHRQIVNIITALNGGQFTYDTTSGASFYTAVGDLFKYLKFNRDINLPGPHQLNCTDCATIVSSAAATVGIHCPMTLIIWKGGFSCNRIQVITNGAPQWRFPFEGTPYVGRFSYHQINVTDDTPVVPTSGIYDACLKIDNGQYPGLNTPPKVPLQPVGLASSETNISRVNVPTNTPYNQQYYRERLVLNGQNASFINTQSDVPGLSTDMTIPSPSEGRREYVDMVKERFNIVETDFATAPKSYDEPDLLKLEGAEDLRIEEKYMMETKWKFTRNGKEYSIQRYLCLGEWTPADLLAHVLSYFTTMDIHAHEENIIGERSFSVADQSIVFYEQGEVYNIKGPDARGLASELVDQMR